MSSLQGIEGRSLALVPPMLRSEIADVSDGREIVRIFRVCAKAIPL